MNRSTAGEHVLLSGAVAAATQTGRARKTRGKRKALPVELDAGLHTLTNRMIRKTQEAIKPQPNTRVQCCDPKTATATTTVYLLPWRVNSTTAMPATLRGRTRFLRTFFETLFSKNVLPNALSRTFRRTLLKVIKDIRRQRRRLDSVSMPHRVGGDPAEILATVV